ncbi:transposase [bacterium]|nr:transposase [bacterium]
MSRPIRISYEGAIYHVMNRGLNRRKVFYTDKDYQKFLDILQDSVSMWDIQIHAVSLMPNHYHLLVETPRANISRAMRHIGAVYTQWFNRKESRDGPLFRGRYKAILVDEDAYLVELLRYIHLNPVKSKLVKQAQDHPWTSQRAYLRSLKSWQWLTTERLMVYFGKDIKSARTELIKFMQAGVPQALEKRLSSRNWPSVFSSKSFERLIEWNFVQDIKNREVRYQPYKIKKLTINTLKKIICESLECKWQEITHPKGRVFKQYRCMALAIIKIELKITYTEISNIFPDIVPSTVSRALQKAPKSNPDLWEYLLANLQNAKSKI